MSTKVVGQSVPRKDATTKVQGSRKFPQDFNMEGQLYAKVVWSAHPHARVLKIHTTQAKACPGVVRVVTAQDVHVNEYGIIVPDQPVLVGEGEKVRWKGDRIAIVVAESGEIAREASRLVEVEYEPLPVVSDPREGMKPGSPLVHPERGDSNIIGHVKIRKGDWEQAFAEADVVVESRYVTPSVEHVYMQPDAGMGYIDEDERITVISASQWAGRDLDQIAHMLALPPDRVRSIVPAVGGAFGGREDMHIQHLLALCAYLIRRPVKMVFERAEVMTRTGKRHPWYVKYKTGATRDGKLTAVEIEIVSDAGAYASTSGSVLKAGTSLAAGPYVVPNAKVDAYAVYTNNAVTTAMRGFGATQAAFISEMQMNKLADALDMDPVGLRKKNLLRDGSVGLTGHEMPPGVGIGEALTQAALAAGWKEEDGQWIRPELGPASAPHKRLGIGVACGLKNVGYGFGSDDKSIVGVQLDLDESGQISRVTVKTAACDVGMGVQTVLAQIAAEALGVAYHRVRVSMTDTASTPDSGSCSASRHVWVSGNALVRACQQALRKRDQILLAETGETIVEAQHQFRGLSVRQTTPYDPRTGMCVPHFAFGYAAQIALVEVDTETGETAVLRFWAAQDVGRAVHPEMVRGQAGGGVHMGLGYALTEEYIQDGGSPKTRHLSDYHISTVVDMPPDFFSVTVEVPDPAGPYGAKGVGEMTTLPTAPAISSGIHDAVGVWVDELPAAPEKVWRAMQRG
ncbi:MAG: molybdopterin-dependent oxidoreductase [Anaerolineae bacterium]|nr:molybdopterin-dependent oxidoreductase [Anaerolineae bacterium]NIN98258.1 molybdopterin-dependent oxidoreductase [Anaerolineae bacterium]NIQ81185.1 molybdopterin-dependent oxidoreductase [Anaerolineae bacterium]